MKIIICPDSFKGSLTSTQAANCIEKGILTAIPNANTIKIPIADGGEGTVEALIESTNGRLHEVDVLDPLMRPIKSFFAVSGDGKTAIIEMAAASGICLLSENEKNPEISSTYGTGQLIKKALKYGVDKIIIGIGGSATNDGGAGAMAALGVKFLDSDGKELMPGGYDLLRLDKIDMSGFVFPLDKVSVETACDVTNPLCGQFGASYVFGPQKGANPQIVKKLDNALSNYAEIIKKDIGKDILNLSGAGAAGGLGAGLVAFLNAELKSGIEMVLDASDFDSHLQGANYVITGEGKIDSQTIHGKTIAGILKRVKNENISVIALAGIVTEDIDELYNNGLTSAFSIANGPITLNEAINNVKKLIETTSYNIARLL